MTPGLTAQSDGAKNSMAWLHRIKYRLIAAFAVPLLVLCVVGVLAYRNTSTLEQSSGQVTHTYQVLQGLETITSTLKTEYRCCS